MLINRRKFIRNTLTASTAIGFVHPLEACGRVAPSDKVNVGLIGVRGQGFNVLKSHLETGQVNCIGLCDVDRNMLETRAADILKGYEQKPKLYSDFRKMLEDKDIDSVIVGTPDHWHCLITVFACQAGKDVYVEKPMANTIEECNIIVRAAKRYRRIVQVGQQKRSAPIWQKVNHMVKDGRIGRLRKVNIWANFIYGIGGLKQPDQQIPAGVDYNFWLGPAPIRPFNPNRFHGNWRMFWDYGGGLMTDYGVHLIDQALWAKDIEVPPRSILVSGGNYSFHEHDHETFDTMSVIYGSDDFTITWESTAGTANGPWDRNFGLAFVGDLATIVVNNSGYRIIPESAEEKDELEISAKGVTGNHRFLHSKNFIDCIKTRNKPNCPPETGRVAAMAAHSANIALRSGSGSLQWDDKNLQYSNSSDANKYIPYNYRKPWELPKI